MSGMRGQVRVLLVDDEPTVADGIEREGDGFEVAVATSAAGGLDRLDDTTFDCVVSAYQLPGKDGIEFLRSVRANHPDLPFVLYAAEGSEAVASEAIAAGVTDYLPAGSGGDQVTELADCIGDAIDRYRSRRASAERTRRLETLVSNLPGIVYRCANEPGWPMEYVDGECEALTGHEPSAIEDGDVSYGDDVIHPDDRDAVWEAVQAALEAGEPFEMTYRIVTAGGERRWVWERGRAVRESGGDPTALEGFITDVTERKERERELARHTEALRELLAAANSLYAAESADDCYAAAISAAVEILGFEWCTVTAPAADADAFEIQAVSEDAPLDEGDRTFETDEGIAGEVLRTGEARVDDDVRDAEQSEPTDDAIRAALTVPVGDWGVFQAVDTTPGAFDERDRAHAELLVTAMATAVERIEREEQLHERTAALERQNERLEQFASVVSHDLRNPLNVAQGQLELAREQYDDDHLAESASAIGRCLELIEELLTLARQGERATDVEPVDLAATVPDCWSEVDTAEATLSVDVQRSIRADDGKLRQLLENLFRNAVEHGSERPHRADAADHGARVRDDAGREGSPVTVRVGELADGFYVADDGPGIPEDERERVFESGYSGEPGGTGYGLEIVEQVASAHGWDVDVAESEAGGARFEVTGVTFAEG